MPAWRRAARARPSPIASRNPFRFNAGHSGASEQPGPRKGAVLSTRTPQRASPCAADLTLSGVAEDRTGGVLVRTAIISTATGLYLVKEGERVEQRIEVLRIAATRVRLRDVVQTDFTLKLRRWTRRRAQSFARGRSGTGGLRDINRA